MTTRIPALAVAAASAAVLAAGCGSSYSGSGGSTAASTTPSGATTVTVASGAGLGTILVGPGGRTIYLFQRDTGPTSTCSGACLAQWPAVTTHGKPQAGGGATASMLGVTKRSDGTTQVTYAGHPLYYYAGDGAAGDVNGQGLDAYGAKWYVVAPSGAADTQQPSGGSTTSGGGGYGY